MTPLRTGTYRPQNSGRMEYKLKKKKAKQEFCPQCEHTNLYSSFSLNYLVVLPSTDVCFSSPTRLKPGLALRESQEVQTLTARQALSIPT